MFNKLSNAFRRVVKKEHASDTLLGCPAEDQAAYDRRMAVMSQMTGGNGFSKFAAPVRRFDDGTTRGERKRKARAIANSKVSETRAKKFMHSYARRWLSEAA